MSASISFQISVPEPHSHLIRVEMTILGLVEESELILRMPVWTPGSYLIREYARHVQELTVRDGAGDRRGAEKIDKASWRVDVSATDKVVVTYHVFAHELTVRTNHVDGSHAFFNCVATCLYPDGQLDQAVDLEIVCPDGWEVFCGLERLEGSRNVFRAEDFDELFDTPVEMGPHEYFDFEVHGVPHRFVVWGENNADMEALTSHIPRIVAQNAEMFGEIPYKKYVFINHLVAGQYGGLEHRHSSVNIYDARGFDRAKPDAQGDFGESYAGFLRLLSHEHFHAYHVKRLRPEALGPFDYQRENYTRALWAVEGVTSYFDTYNLLEARLISPGRYIELLEKRITDLHDVPGRALHSLEDAGFDAWIKFYRPNENTRNSTVSYYLKGEVVVWLIDLWIRNQTDGKRTMADALRRLWHEYYKTQDVGFPRGAGQDAVSAVAEADADDVFRRLVRGTEPIEWEEFLAPCGLRLREKDKKDDDAKSGERGYLGIKTKSLVGDRVKVKFVARRSPAETAGLYAGDEIVAINGWSVRENKVDDLIGEVSPGEALSIHLLRRSRLVEVKAVAQKAPPQCYRIERRHDASSRALQLLEGWLGATTWKEK